MESPIFDYDSTYTCWKKNSKFKQSKKREGQRVNQTLTNCVSQEVQHSLYLYMNIIEGSMSVADLQLQIHQAIDSITDEKKLEAVFTLLKGGIEPFQRMTLKEYVDQIDEAKKQVNEGKYLSADDLEKESENW